MRQKNEFLCRKSLKLIDDKDLADEVVYILFDI